jgi:hypothetical protein
VLVGTGVAFTLLQGLAHGEPGVAGAGTGDPTLNGKPRPAADKICRALTQAVTDNGLPLEFFTRLIWQESRFDPTR